jgi:hypothetical protein
MGGFIALGVIDAIIEQNRNPQSTSSGIVEHTVRQPRPRDRDCPRPRLAMGTQGKAGAQMAELVYSSARGDDAIQPTAPRFVDCSLA